MERSLPAAATKRSSRRLRANWSDGTIKGVINQVDGLAFFEARKDAPPLSVHLLSSEALQAFFPRLDSFEGTRYRRILAPVMTPDDEIVVASVYAKAD